MIKFPINKEGRDFVLGDLHGCYDLLMDELDAVSFDKEKDRVFSVGDLIDRGPDSMKCLELLFEPWFHAVRGNHEDMMFKGILEQDAGSFQCWVMNGGLWHLDLREEDPEGFDTLIESYLSLMPLAIEVATKDGSIGILHADAPEVWDEESINKNQLNTLWGRHRIFKKDVSLVENIDKVFVGHTPVSGVQQYGNVYYVDTGGCFNNDLTLLEIRNA